jgi:hypothetical protein
MKQLVVALAMAALLMSSCNGGVFKGYPTRDADGSLKCPAGQWIGDDGSTHAIPVCYGTE